MSVLRPVYVSLRKQYSTQAWGFRMIGGIKHGQPLIIQKVAPGSFAQLAGIQDGDQLIQVGNIHVHGMTHGEVQEIILRSGNNLDLVLVRKSTENSDTFKEQTQQLPKQQQKHILVHKQYNSPLNIYSKENVETLTKEVLQEGTYYTETRELKPQSPGVKQTQERYIEKKLEETKYLYEMRPNQSTINQQSVNAQSSEKIDKRVFGSSNRPKSPKSPTPVSPEGQFHLVDNRVFGSGQKPTWQPSTPETKDTRVFGVGNSPKSPSSPIPYFQESGSQNIQPKVISYKPVTSSIKRELVPQDKQPRSEDRRVFGINPKFKPAPYKPDKMMPIIKSNTPDQILPSQARHEQSYLTHLPPTGIAVHQVPTGTTFSRRRIHPVWPPRDYEKTVSKVAFDSPGKKQNFSWPPSEDEDSCPGTPKEYCLPVARKGSLTNSWNPRSGSATPPHLKCPPTGKVKQVIWPPMEFRLKEARWERQSSLPPDAEHLQHSDKPEEYLVYYNPNKIPQTYRQPPESNQFYLNEKISYHYDTD